MLDRDDTFLRSQVREQRSRHHVADSVHALLDSLLMLVDLDKTLFDFDLRTFQSQAFSERHAPDRHQKHLGLELYLLAF